MTRSETVAYLINFDWIGAVFFCYLGDFMKEMKKLIEMIDSLDIDLNIKSEILLQIGRADGAVRRELNEK